MPSRQVLKTTLGKHWRVPVGRLLQKVISFLTKIMLLTNWYDVLYIVSLSVAATAGQESHSSPGYFNSVVVEEDEEEVVVVVVVSHTITKEEVKVWLRNQKKKKVIILR